MGLLGSLALGNAVAAAMAPREPLGPIVAVMLLIALLVVSFLLGSIPWGVVISKGIYKRDIRDSGSGNIGTTNALRTLGKKGGAAVFVLDFGKGLLSGFLGFLLASAFEAQGYDGWRLALAVAFLGCVWGHIFSPWLGFHGGKGIAVAVGCIFFVFGPVGALLELAVFILFVAITRYVSVGSLAAAMTCPLFAAFFLPGDIVAWFVVSAVAVTVVWAHRENIDRLANGTESRLGSKSEAKQ